jgi:hypothetical protein
MSTSPTPNSKSSYERSFDDMANRNPLLFRLHSPTSCSTFFHPREKVLVASLHRQGLGEDSTSEELSRQLTDLQKVSSPLTLERDSEAVEKHITSRCNDNEEPSAYISLTFNVLYVLWMWKRRISSPKFKGQNDFRIIVLNSSELRATSQAKMGTQLLTISKEHKKALSFARPHEEVIVAKCIQSEAILGSMPLSRLEDFIPSWCRNGKLLETTNGVSESKKSTFELSLPPEVTVDKVDCTRVHESLLISLALLASMLVPDGKQRADIGSGKEASCGGANDSERSSTEVKSPRVEPTRGRDSETVLVSGLAEDGYVSTQSLPYIPITYHVRFKWESNPYIVQEAKLLSGDGKPTGRDDWRKSRTGASGQAEKTIRARGRTTPGARTRKRQCEVI